MLVHLAVLGLVCFLGVLIYQRDTDPLLRERNLIKKNRMFVILVVACLFVVIAFRANTVGLDTPTYYAYFRILDRRPGYAAVLGWEPLYLLINRIGTLFDSYQFVLAVCAGITVVGYGYFCYKNTDRNTSAFWFFYFFITLNLYFNSMHLVRQMCAIAISINVYTVLKQGTSVKSYIKAAILLVLGACFHISAVIAVAFMVPFMLKKVSRRTIFWVVVICLIGIAFLTVAQGLVFKLVPRFAKYLNDDRLSEGHAGVYSIVMIALKIFMIVYCLKLDDKNPNNQEIYRLTFITVIGTAFYILQFRTQFALRIGYYFESFMPLYIPVFIRRIKGKSNRTLAYILMFLFGLTYFIYMMEFGGVKSNRGCVPYSFFWQ